MTKETWYITNDGTKFNDEALAEKHEAELLEAEARAKADAEAQETLLKRVKEAEDTYIALAKEYTEKYGAKTVKSDVTTKIDLSDDIRDLIKALDTVFVGYLV